MRPSSPLRTGLMAGLVSASLLSFAVTASAQAQAAQPTVTPTSVDQGLDTRLAVKAAPRPRPTKFGATAPRQDGESLASAVARQTEAYGNLGSLRLFYPGLPADWAKISAEVPKTTLVISFKANPAEVLTGQHDAALSKWFAEAPTGRRIWWSYWHEPEDDIERGAFTSEQYRAAWTRIAGLARATRNWSLRPTLVLMCWTAEKNSGRTWSDYYAEGSVKLLSWDCYNSGHRKNVYKSPAKILENVNAITASTGLPWGISELGSVLVAGDATGEGRAEWIGEVSDLMAAQGARFVTYFDSDIGVDYRLHDEPSRLSWRAQVSPGSS